MDQENLFHETPEDAIGAVIGACGGFQKVATLLWPTRKPQSAYARLKACLDDSKDEKLTLSEIIAIARMGRESGAHAFMNFLTSELAYTAVKPIAPIDHAAQRLDEVKKLLELTEKNQRLIKAQMDSLTQLQASSLRLQATVTSIRSEGNRRA